MAQTINKNMRIIDSHTGGEPTRTIVEGGPDLGQGTMKQRLKVFRQQFDHIRTTLIGEPRGSAVMVGALLCPPEDSNNTTGVIFFNNADYLGMCGHGTIGLMVTLYHMGKVDLGIHRIETPVGVIEVELLSPSKVRIENVPSYRHAQDVKVRVQGHGEVTGDIAWGGNWFFLAKDHGQCLTLDKSLHLLDFTWKVKQALEQQGITGKNGEAVDHIELFGQPTDQNIADSQNFVLCPGKEFDRSPCGTGTSAKLACLYEDGVLKPKKTWRQQSIIGSIFEGFVEIVDGQTIPNITGDSFVTMDSVVLVDRSDPFEFGF